MYCRSGNTLLRIATVPNGYRCTRNKKDYSVCIGGQCRVWFYCSVSIVKTQYHFCHVNLMEYLLLFTCVSYFFFLQGGAGFYNDEDGRLDPQTTLKIL